MHYVDEGRGKPILFVHGNPAHSFIWRSAVAHFSRMGYRCIAPDNIGFGLSEKPENFSHTPANHAAHLKALVEHLDLQDITLVVHDFGGPIGLSLTLDMPERVRRVVMFNTWFWDLARDPNVAKMAKAVRGVLGKMMYLNGNMAPKLVKPLFCDKGRYTEEFHESLFRPLCDRNARIGTYKMALQLLDAGPWFDELWHQREVFVAKPTAIIWGTKDPNFGQKALDKVWHELPLAEVTPLECGPYVLEERPREALAAMEHFLRQAPMSV
jgi:haloalkane dehalogenase